MIDLIVTMMHIVYIVYFEVQMIAPKLITSIIHQREQGKKGCEMGKWKKNQMPLLQLHILNLANTFFCCCTHFKEC